MSVDGAVINGPDCWISWVMVGGTVVAVGVDPKKKGVGGCTNWKVGDGCVPKGTVVGVPNVVGASCCG